MSDALIELVTKQSEKLDEHLSHLRNTIHATNENLQGVIGTVQLTRRDMSHMNDMNLAQLESLKVSIHKLEIELDKVGNDLKSELDNMDVELNKLKESKEKVDSMYKAYNVIHRVVITSIAGGVMYATYLITKIKTGG